MKHAFPTRTQKRKLLLAFLIFITAASVFGFTKSIHYGPVTDLSLARHYVDKGECPGIGISNAKLKTKFVDNKLLYMLNLTVAKGKHKKLPPSFTIKLVDKDGFDIHYFTISSSYFTEELDAAEKSVGYSYQSAQLMDAEKYKSVEQA
ncbi:MAG: hypothetical protein EOP45_22440 [Sphingobacteriaceae bacterium]|nr:MAG: hypothetical protein EOP45_22440 [Sphingobacteriaceae bacterium]